jgi:hypothetical protein
MISWRQFGTDEYLYRDNETRPLARLRESSELPGLWSVIAPRTAAGEHEKSAARAIALRLAHLPASAA